MRLLQSTKLLQNTKPLQNNYLLQSIHRYDLLTFGWCLRRKHRDLLVTLSRFISRTADGPLYLVSAALLAYSDYDKMVTLLALGFAVERTVYFVTKRHFRRNRPPEAIPGFQSIIQPSDQFSFPSGHTSAAFLIAELMSHTFPVLGWILYPWACAVGGARIMLGVHFPSDIVAGALLGHALGLLALALAF